jgi:hypothetical protein
MLEVLLLEPSARYSIISLVMCEGLQRDTGLKLTYCHDVGDLDGVWIDESIYLQLTGRNYK